MELECELTDRLKFRIDPSRVTGFILLKVPREVYTAELNVELEAVLCCCALYSMQFMQQHHNANGRIVVSVFFTVNWLCWHSWHLIGCFGVCAVGEDPGGEAGGPGTEPQQRVGGPAHIPGGARL